MLKLVYTILLASSFLLSNATPAILFTAQPGISKIDLTWEAKANDTENCTYIIERSKEGELWAEILVIPSASGTSGKEKFMESDMSPIYGTSFYRLKKVNANGLVAYSNISVVRHFYSQQQIIANCREMSVTEFEHTGFDNEGVVVTLKDRKGNEYYSKVYLLNVNDGLVAVDLEEQLTPGAYTITACGKEPMTGLNVMVR